MSAWRTLVQAEELAAGLGRADLAIVDCRFEFGDPQAARRAWHLGHLPGASYADLDQDLSDLRRHGHGRHPLPQAEALCERLTAWGITPAHQVVVYDANDGAMAASRLWMLLRLLGHSRVAVLDGGLRRWQALGLPMVEDAPLVHAGAPYRAQFDTAQLIDTDEVLQRLALQPPWLIDARAAARYRGEVEPIDPVAGHVPGAVNRPYTDNLGDDGRFLPAARLREAFSALVPDRHEGWAVMCGSGVTACHHLLAMTHAGIDGVRLYADSWSGWIADPARPVARGDSESAIAS